MLSLARDQRRPFLNRHLEFADPRGDKLLELLDGIVQHRSIITLNQVRRRGTAFAPLQGFLHYFFKGIIHFHISSQVSAFSSRMDSSGASDLTANHISPIRDQVKGFPRSKRSRSLLTRRPRES